MLNLLRPSHMNPCLSVELYLNGAFEFNRTPLVPLRTRVLIFEGLNKRRTFEHNGVEGCYLRPSPDNYQCYTIYIPDTRSESIIKTVELSPHDFPVPKLSSADATRQSVEDLMKDLSNTAPWPPFSIGDDQFQAIKTLHKILVTSLPTIYPNTAPSPRVISPVPITAPSLRVTLPDPITTSALRVPRISPQQPIAVAPQKSQSLHHISMGQTVYIYAIYTQILTAHKACRHFEAN